MFTPHTLVCPILRRAAHRWTRVCCAATGATARGCAPARPPCTSLVRGAPSPSLWRSWRRRPRVPVSVGRLLATPAGGANDLHRIVDDALPALVRGRRSGALTDQLSLVNGTLSTYWRLSSVCTRTSSQDQSMCDGSATAGACGPAPSPERRATTSSRASCTTCGPGEVRWLSRVAEAARCAIGTDQGITGYRYMS